MNKRGISNIIIVLLSILLVLAAIIMVWNVVKTFTKQQAEISQVKTQLLGVRMSIFKTYIEESNPSQISVTIRKEKGKEELVSSTTTSSSSSEVDIISVVDLSTSMRVCYSLGVSQGQRTACCNSLGGTLYGTTNCYGVNEGMESTCISSSCLGTWNDKLLPIKNANKEMVSTLLTSNPDARIGLVGYSGSVTPANTLDLTNDPISLNAKIDYWNIGPSTCICCGIIDAAQKFETQSPSERPKAMIVMSDGFANGICSSLGDVGDMNLDGLLNRDNDYAINASWKARNELSNIMIYTVGFGNPANPSDLDSNTLKNISFFGGGQYYYAEVSSISTVYQSLTSEIINTYTTVKSNYYLKIIFYNATTSYSESIQEPPLEVFKSKKFDFDLSGKISNVNKIEIYPVVLTSSGKEVFGDVLDTWVK